MTRRSRSKLWIRASLLIVLVAGSAFAVRQLRHNRAVPDLPTATARRGVFSVLVSCRGELNARRSVQLTAPLDTPDLQIVWLAPANGPVTQGMTVVRFDPSKLQQDLKEKTAAYHQAEATLDQAVAQARITADQDKLDLATARYQMDRASLEASKQAIVSAAEGQKSAIDLGLAQEKVKLQQATTQFHKSSDDAKIASLRRLRDEAKAEVDRTVHRLSLMEMKSPLDGVINYLPNTSQGWMNTEPFKVGDHASAGLAIAEIPDLKTLEMESKVDEVDRGRIAIGDTVLVHVDAFPEKVLTAKLQSISPLTEQSFNEWPPTRSFRAHARLETPDPRMRPGMNAAADIVQSKIPGAISIPAKALFTLHGKPVVYLKSNGQYVPAEIRVRARNTDEVAVEGIAAGAVVALADPEQPKQ